MSMLIRRWIESLLACCYACTLALAGDDASTLERGLLKENAVELAREARTKGDASRGAAVFYRAELNCAKCHVFAAKGERSLGPNLALLGKEVQDEQLVESILDPSKSIKKDYETVTLATNDGKTATGLFVGESADEVVLTDLAHDGKPFAIKK